MKMLCSPLRYVLIITAITNITSSGLCDALNDVMKLNDEMVVTIESEPHMVSDGELRYSDFAFSPSEILRMSAQYVLSNNIAFNWQSNEARILIPSNTDCMVYVWCAPEVGKPALLLRINFKANIVAASLAVATISANKCAPLVVGTETPTVEAGLGQNVFNMWTPILIDANVRKTVNKRGIVFDFSKVELMGLSIPRSRRYLAKVWYRSDFGKPSLVSTVNFDGTISESHIGTARPDKYPLSITN